MNWTEWVSELRRVEVKLKSEYMSSICWSRPKKIQWPSIFLLWINSAPTENYICYPVLLYNFQIIVIYSVEWSFFHIWYNLLSGHRQISKTKESLIKVILTSNRRPLVEWPHAFIINGWDAHFKAKMSTTSLRRN